MNKIAPFQKISTGDMRFNKGFKESVFYSLFLFLFNSAAIIALFILAFRLFQLTVVKGEYFRRLSEENRIKEILIEPQRGQIVDRRGLTVAQNTQAPVNEFGDRLVSKRSYQSPEALAHLIGYRQIADKNDTDDSSCLTKPHLNDRVGRKGIEKVYECELKGRLGKKLVELDALGKYLKTLSVLPPQDGQILQLSLDLELQKKAYDAMNPDGLKKGAVVGLKPQTGEVLILMSSPSFNPQNFEDNNNRPLKGYLIDEDKPLFNRATEGAYAPGSIIKPFIAAGALEDKKIDEKTIVVDEGKIKAGPLEFGNWYFLQYGKTEGPVDMVKAIRRSNDIYFYKVGEKLGPAGIKKWAEKFGLARKTSLPFEQAEGLIPSPFWKEETLKDRWYLGDSYNLAIGQGYALVTPLQVALATSVLANDSKLCEPRLLKNEKPKCKKLNLSQKTLDIVREGMRQACAVGGTGWPFFEFKVHGTRIEVGCKTGTAESAGQETAPHAWFTVFAPYKNPEIVITVLVEEGGQGSDVAAPIAKEVLQTYFERKE